MQGQESRYFCSQLNVLLTEMQNRIACCVSATYLCDFFNSLQFSATARMGLVFPLHPFLQPNNWVKFLRKERCDSKIPFAEEGFEKDLFSCFLDKGNPRLV